MQKCTAALRPLMETYALATSTIGNTYWANEMRFENFGGQGFELRPLPNLATSPIRKRSATDTFVLDLWRAFKRTPVRA